jgi:hypothetical protein
MKLDKETFIKYHFWYMLGLLVPLIFLVLIMLWTSTAGAVSDLQKKIDDKKNALQGVLKSEAKNQKWVDVLDKKLKLVTEQETKNWKEAWEPQSTMMTWPPALAEPEKNAYFLDDIDKKLRADYTKEDQYASQIPPIVELVQPVNSRGEGVVQCASGNWDSFLHTADWGTNPQPASEEIWLAQEDLWVQRELLRVIRESNDSVATFKKLDNPPKIDKAKNEIDHQIFVNPTWRIEMVLSGEIPKFHLRSHVTNISTQRQVLGITFALGFRGTKATDTLVLDGEPMAPNESIDRDQILGGQLELSPAEGLESVKQNFDWRTAAIKRVEKIGMGIHSQRTHSRGLKPPATTAKGDAKTGSGAKSSGGGGQPPARSRGGERDTGGGTHSGDKSTTSSGLRLERYVEITPYVRRMPIALVLIVDQTNIQDVLTAMANSNLRVQITQWHWTRFHGSVKPPTPEGLVQRTETPVVQPVPQPVAAPPPKAVLPPTIGGVGGGLGSDSPFAGGGAAPASRPPPPPPPPSRPTPRAASAGPVRGARAAAAATRIIRPQMEDQEMELVELSVYGIASLYERYPPKSAVAAAAPAQPATKAGAPAAPAKPGAPATK